MESPPIHLAPRAPSRQPARARSTSAALPTFAMLQGALAALGCASAQRPVEPSVPSAVAPAGATDDARGSEPVAPGVARGIEDAAVGGATHLTLPAPAREPFALAGVGPAVDFAAPSRVSMVIRGGTVEDRTPIVAARARVRACADRVDAPAQAEIELALSPTGVASALRERPGSDPSLAGCLRELWRSAGAGASRPRAVIAVEVTVEPPAARD